MSIVFLLFSCCFFFLNLNFKNKWEYLLIAMAEKRLARLGYNTAAYLKPNVSVVNHAQLGSMGYRKALKRIEKDVDLLMQNGRILVEKEGSPAGRFCVFSDHEQKLRIVTLVEQKADNLG